jgi:hypothetical protein
VVTSANVSDPYITDIVGHIDTTVVCLVIAPMQVLSSTVYALTLASPTEFYGSFVAIIQFLGRTHILNNPPPSVCVTDAHLLTVPHSVALEQEAFTTVSTADVFATRRAAIAAYFISSVNL